MSKIESKNIVNIEPIKHLIEKFEEIEIEGKKIYILDGLFDQNVIDIIYKFCKSENYNWGDGDDARSNYSKRFKKMFNTQEIQNPIFDYFKDFFSSMLNEDFVIERFYLNMNTFGEIHFPHIDSKTGYTGLYFANKEWEDDWRGYLYFYDNEEAIRCIYPKPGRIVLFDGSLFHRGSAPSRICFEPRINLVFKFELKSMLQDLDFHGTRIDKMNLYDTDKK